MLPASLPAYPETEDENKPTAVNRHTIGGIIKEEVQHDYQAATDPGIQRMEQFIRRQA